MEYGSLWEELQDAIWKLAEPFNSLAEALQELNDLLYEDELTPKDYARQKCKNPRNDISRSIRNSYSYFPMPQRNLPYQRRIF
jgi:hypothetical protein